MASDVPDGGGSRRRRAVSSSSSSSSESVASSLDAGRTVRAGLNFPVGLVGRSLKRGGFSQRIGGGAPVYVAAVLEYLATEVLDLAGHAAELEFRARAESSDGSDAATGATTRRAVKTITPAHIEHAIRSDGELQRVMRDIAQPPSSPNTPVDMDDNGSQQEGEEEEEEEEDEDDGEDDEDGSRVEDDASESASQGGESQTSQDQPPSSGHIFDPPLPDTHPSSDGDDRHSPSSSLLSDVDAGVVVASSPLPPAATAFVASFVNQLKRKVADVAVAASDAHTLKRHRAKPTVPLFDGSLPTSAEDAAAAACDEAASSADAAPTPLLPPHSPSPPPHAASPPASSSMPPAVASTFTDNLQALNVVMPHLGLLACSRVLEEHQNNLAQAILFLHRQQQQPATPIVTQSSPPSR